MNLTEYVVWAGVRWPFCCAIVTGVNVLWIVEIDLSCCVIR